MLKIGSCAQNLCESILVFYGTFLHYHKGKGRIINTVVRLIPSLGKGQRSCLRDGVLWELDLECFIQRAIYYGCYEPRETLYLRQIVKSGWTIIDVGANIGYYCLLVGKWVGPKGLIYAFEPQPDIFNQLCRNISLNKMGWIKPYQSALGDVIEQRYMTSVLRSNRGVQRIAVNKDKGVNQVEVTTLDEFVEHEKLNKIDLIKVDIEGFEFKFLKGAKRAINKFNPILLIELNTDSLIANETNVNQVLDLLREYGYVMYFFDRNTLQPLEKLPTAGQYFNIIAKPATR